jgi:DNA mismatch repair protein MutS2
MNDKNLRTLEFYKVLDRLAGYAAFSLSSEMARSLRPSTDINQVQILLAQTTEARRLLSINYDLSIGGASDVRHLADLAAHGGVLEPQDLLEIKATLVSARTMARTFEKLGEDYPHLASIASELPSPFGLVDSITRSISDQGEILDTASEKLASVRHELAVSHERLISRLERIINDPKTIPMLQEALITQRDERYVIPLRAEFKGRVKSIVHDQSSSGATLFVEPLVVVELNNRWRELQLEERDEERRILTELSRQVGEYAGHIIRAVETLAALDLAFMRARYADDLRAVEPIIHPLLPQPGIKNPGAVIRLYQARHPLLDPEKVVPLDIDLDSQTYAMVITGPNTGGKTVTLKTVGLLVLMVETGLHIPVQSGSEICLFKSVYVDIGDEQSIEQSLSTFSGHIRNIVTILKQADQHSLVLLDELGAGTDPQEGASLARSILAYLLDKGIVTLIATHYPELKTYAHATPGVVNASVEFDLKTLRPTYHLTIGLPGRSNALAIAERLGLPQDIINSARSAINPDDLRAEDLLDEIHRQRDAAHQARSAAEKARSEAETLRKKISDELEKIEEERRLMLEKARLEVEKQVESLETEIQDIRRELIRARQPLEKIRQVEEQAGVLDDQIEKLAKQKSDSIVSKQKPLQIGEHVKIKSLDMEGVVTNLDEEEVEIQVGVLRLRARYSEIKRKNDQDIKPTKHEQKKHAESQKRMLLPESPGMEIDLRGYCAEDALSLVESHLDSAYLAGLPFVRIIHGKGTGRLRQVIRQYVNNSPHVSKWEPGQENEGGDGVTIVKIKMD